MVAVKTQWQKILGERVVHSEDLEAGILRYHKEKIGLARTYLKGKQLLAKDYNIRVENTGNYARGKFYRSSTVVAMLKELEIHMTISELLRGARQETKKS